MNVQKTDIKPKDDKMNTQTERKALFEDAYNQKTLSSILKDFEKDYNTYKNRSAIKCQEVVFKYTLPLSYGYKLNSIRNNLSRMKKIIRDQGVNEGKYAVNTLSFIDVMLEKIAPSLNKAYDQKVEDRANNQENNELDVVEEIKRIKNILSGTIEVNRNQTIEQVRSYYLAYILGLSTGRRFSEILKTAQFSKHGKKQMVKGLLKKRKDDKQDFEAFFIELTYKEVQSYLKELREYINSKLVDSKNKTIEEVTEGEINSIFSKVYNNATVRISLKDQEGNPLVKTFHDLRHHYSVTGRKLFMQDEKDKNYVEATILGKEAKRSTYSTTK